MRYLIPHGYVGWVQVRYEVGGAPALPIEDGFYVVRFDGNGDRSTSSIDEPGWRTVEYYYSGQERVPIRESPWGGDWMIWQDSAPPEKTERFFVGPEKIFRRLGESKHRMTGPIDPTALAEAGGPVLPDAYLIPDGYVGWIEVLHSVPDAPPARVEDGHYLIEIPPDGRAATSSRGDYDWARNAYFYVAGGTRRPLPRTTESGVGRMIWGGRIGEGDPGSFNSSSTVSGSASDPTR